MRRRDEIDRDDPGPFWLTQPQWAFWVVCVSVALATGGLVRLSGEPASAAVVMGLFGGGVGGWFAAMGALDFDGVATAAHHPLLWRLRGLTRVRRVSRAYCFRRARLEAARLAADRADRAQERERQRAAKPDRVAIALDRLDATLARHEGSEDGRLSIARGGEVSLPADDQARLRLANGTRASVGRRGGEG